MTSKLLRLVAFIVAAAVSLGASAQKYPSKPIRLVVPFAAGGGTDVVARLIAQRLGHALSQNMLVDNRPAMDGILGTEIVARAAPDGYTLLIASSSHAINAALGRKLPYDTIRDFAPIIQVSNQQLLLVVHPSVPVNNVAELLDYVKARPGKLNYGSSSNAVALPMELLKSMTGIDVLHIPYKGSGPMLNDLLGGQIHMAVAGAIASVPHVKAGRLRALGIGDARRSAFLPETPTIAESGVPGYQAVIWAGMFAPAGTPRPVVETLNAEIGLTLRTPEIREKLGAQGADPVGGTPEEWGAFLVRELEKWARVAAAAGFKAE